MWDDLEEEGRRSGKLRTRLLRETRSMGSGRKLREGRTSVVGKEADSIAGEIFGKTVVFEVRTKQI